MYNKTLSAAVLPIHPTQRDRLDLYRAAILINSMAINGSLEFFDEFLVVVPNGTVDAGNALKLLAGNRTRLRVVSESELFSSSEIEAMSTLSGWYRQQIIKLSAPRITSCASILLLDSDCVNIRRLDNSAFSSGGRLPTQFGAQMEAWKLGSAKIIGTSAPVRTMSVTPAFVDRDILVTLHQMLSPLGTSWIQALCDAARGGTTWTEYMLYQCAGEKTGLFSERHTESSVGLHMGLWRNGKANPEWFETAKSRQPFFLVVQSIRNDFDAVQSMLRENGLPSYFDISAFALTHVSCALDVCTRATSVVPRYAALRQALEIALKESRSKRPKWRTLGVAVHDIVSGGRIKQNPFISRFVAAVENEDTDKLTAQLFSCTVGEKMSPALVEHYHRVLLEQGRFLSLSADLLLRISKRSLDIATLRRSLLALASTGQTTLLCRILMAARRLFPQIVVLELLADLRMVLCARCKSR